MMGSDSVKLLEGNLAHSLRSIVFMKLLESNLERGRAFLVDVFIYKARTLKFHGFAFRCLYGLKTSKNKRFLRSS